MSNQTNRESRDPVLRRDGHCCMHCDQYGERREEPATDVNHILPGDK